MGFEAGAALLSSFFSEEAGVAVLGDAIFGSEAIGSAALAGDAAFTYAGGDLAAMAAGGELGAGSIAASTFGADAASVLAGTSDIGIGAASAGGGSGSAGGLFGTGITGTQVMQGAQLGSSLYGMYQGSQLSSAAKGADPFAAYRPGYAAQLQQLMQNPNSVTSLPGYQFGMDQSIGALTKNLASQGLTGSGTAAQAITNQGQQYAGQFYQQQLQNLAGLSGANMNNAGTSLAGQAAGTNLQNNSMNNFFKILPDLMKSWGG